MASKLRFPVDPRLQPCKFDACGGCLKKPSGKEKFAMCKGCRMQPYCPKECQRKDWKDHKAFCKQTQDVYKHLSAKDVAHATPSGKPSRMERYVLMRDFWRVHKPSFLQAITCMRKSSTPPVDPDTDAIVFSFSYRPDNGGNPAMMYTLDGFFVEKLEELFSEIRNMRETWDAGADIREKEAEALRAVDSVGGKYIQHLPVALLVDGEWDRWVPIPLFGLTEDEAAYTGEEDEWFDLLTYFIKEGFVFELHSRTKEMMMGKMVKHGKEWRWQVCLSASDLDPVLGYKMLN